jgi:hypothetical protein
MFLEILNQRDSGLQLLGLNTQIVEKPRDLANLFFVISARRP